MAKYCDRCGMLINDDASFCKYCGAKQDYDKSLIHNLNEFEPEEQLNSGIDDDSLDSTEGIVTKKMWGFIIIASIIVIATAIIGLVMYFGVPGIDGSDKQKKESNNDDSVVVTEYEGRRYAVYNESMTWQDAEKQCEKMGGHLATITTLGEQVFVEETIENQGIKKNYWLGGTDEKEEGVWTWVTGEEWSYTNWRKNQPDNQDNDYEDGDQDYLEIGCGSTTDGRYMKWWDVANSGIAIGYEGDPNYRTTEHTGFICEWENDK